VAGSKYLEWLLKPIMFKIKYFTLVNIIPEKEVIQELVGQRFTQANIQTELHRLLTDEAYRSQMLQEYQHIQTILGWETAPKNAAEMIVKSTNNTQQ
jgi:lipid-A-disaccharide synthase